MVPMAFVLHPGLLLMGTYANIIFTSIIAIGAAIILGCGLAGYCLNRLNMAQRALLVFGAILLILPSNVTLMIGFLLITTSMLWARAIAVKSLGTASV